ncbi:uncharacterized protein LOC124253768 [Haliotis rubra]|uniref:uncharacterized protein LOC124253768 n=1 Tax=Haliotis rubra TaxID=36100 RepID=UPI001EE5EEB0|nr:uncharacterized protein LOC124253768 [Haliotis rubra]XP_046543551.1 uncharacterized protein LOC124253768 [Haliotis rubra]
MKAMDGVKTYYFPNITTTAVPRVASIRPAVTTVSSCVIDTPRDDGQRQRETLWSFQKQHRGVKGQGDTLPNIPFRLRSTEIESQGDVNFLDSFMSGTFTDGSLMRQLTRTRTNLQTRDAIPSLKGEVGVFGKGINIPLTKSLRLCSREKRKGRHHSSGFTTERLPRMSGQNESCDGIKKTSSEMDVRQEIPGRPPSNISDGDSSSLVDVNSDNIGHTTHCSTDTRRTLADILNRHDNSRYQDLSRKALEGSSFSQTVPTSVSNSGPNKQWINKFEMKIVDGDAYDNFARTRKPDSDKDTTKGDSKSVKRPYNQRSSDLELLKPSEVNCNTVTQKDGSPVRKIAVATSKTTKHTKLRLSLSNSRSIE